MRSICVINNLVLGILGGSILLLTSCGPEDMFREDTDGVKRESISQSKEKTTADADADSASFGGDLIDPITAANGPTEAVPGSPFYEAWKTWLDRMKKLGTSSSAPPAKGSTEDAVDKPVQVAGAFLTCVISKAITKEFSCGLYDESGRLVRKKQQGIFVEFSNLDQGTKIAVKHVSLYYYQWILQTTGTVKPGSATQLAIQHKDEPVASFATKIESAPITQKAFDPIPGTNFIPQWYLGEPSNGYTRGLVKVNSENCAVSDGRYLLKGWNDVDCELRLRYACQNTTNPLDWKISEGFGEAANFADACPEGYKFAVPKSLEEDHALTKVRDEAGNIEVWIKYNDIKVEGNWTDEF